MNATTKLTFGALLGLSLLSGATFAQEDPITKIIPSLEYQDADVREALRALFRTVNVSYSISPDVTGTVNVSLKNVTLESALQNITRQVDATYKIEGGVFVIQRRPQDTTPLGGDTANLEGVQNAQRGVIRRIKIRSADPQFIALMLSGTQSYQLSPERSTIDLSGGMGGGMMGGMGGGMMGGMGGGMGGMMGGMGGGMGGMMGGMGGMGGGGMRGF